MLRRRAVLPLVAVAAACAAAIPIMGTAAPGDLLPDLRADAPDQPLISRYFDGRLLLRFYGYVTNIGDGPLEIGGNPAAGDMHQRVLNGGSMQDRASVPVFYETADGHNHFHLKRIMRYSLRTAGGSEVAPGQKVGFCLVDSQSIGSGADPVYSVGGNNFCGQGEPNRQDLTMGVSVGYRDIYHSGLAMQWVDISDTTPGVYYLAAQADPNDIVAEKNETNTVTQSSSPVVVPGYIAKKIGPLAAAGNGQTQIPLQADQFGSSLAQPGPVGYEILSQPARGSVAVNGSTAVYTAAAGTPGVYSFTYAAFDTNSPNPTTRRTATVTLQVGATLSTAVTISGAPASLIAGTSAQLSATVVNGGPGVTWSASAGTISPTGLFVAPATAPPGGTVTITATSTAAPTISASATIAITTPPPPVPAPLPPGKGNVNPGGAAQRLSDPIVKRNGRFMVVRTVSLAKGRLTVTAIRAHHRVARCTKVALPGRRMACKLVLPRRLAHSSVKLVVALRAIDGSRAVARGLAKG